MLKTIFSIALTLSLLSSAQAENNFMDENWAKAACEAWNAEPSLTKELFTATSEEDDEGYSWISNDADRGYKLIQIYRTDCGEKSKIQLNIVQKNEEAICDYAGKPDGKEINVDVDYVMYASDKNWTCIGDGDLICGVMGALMSGKLKFHGPKLEAMRVMSPFRSFLLLTGKISGAKGIENCPDLDITNNEMPILPITSPSQEDTINNDASLPRLEPL